MEATNNSDPPKITQQLLDKTWVYEGREYVLTGRVASQKTRSMKLKTLFEIMPFAFAKNSPSNINYNKWVRPNELFTISGENALIKPKEEQSPP